MLVIEFSWLLAWGSDVLCNLECVTSKWFGLNEMGYVLVIRSKKIVFRQNIEPNPWIDLVLLDIHRLEVGTYPKFKISTW